MGGGDAVDHAGVVAARERPLRLELGMLEPVGVELVERRRVDRDDGDILGLSGRAADRKACVDRPQLERPQRMSGIRAQTDRRRERADAKEECRARPSTPFSH